MDENEKYNPKRLVNISFSLLGDVVHFVETGAGVRLTPEQLDSLAEYAEQIEAIAIENYRRHGKCVKAAG